MLAPNAIPLAVVSGLVAGWVTAGRGEKSSDLRLFDVLALGPWLAIVAAYDRPLREWERVAIAFTAGATIAHNGRNWLVSRSPAKS